jgi:pyruvate dehydrogenase E1 component
MPEGAEEGIRRGMYCLQPRGQADVRLLAARPLLKEAVRAAQMLSDDLGIVAEVWSVTSYTELARDGIASQRAARLGVAGEQPYVTQELGASSAPVVALSDYVRAIPESIRTFVPVSYATLGTDGFGRSDTRANLRDFFAIDAKWIAYTALGELPAGKDAAQLKAYAETLGLDLVKPWSATV